MTDLTGEEKDPNINTNEKYIPTDVALTLWSTSSVYKANKRMACGR